MLQYFVPEYRAHVDPLTTSVIYINMSYSGKEYSNGLWSLMFSRNIVHQFSCGIGFDTNLFNTRICFGEAKYTTDTTRLIHHLTSKCTTAGRRSPVTYTLMLSGNIVLQFSWYNFIETRICLCETKLIAGTTWQVLINNYFVCFITYKVLELEVSCFNETHVYIKHVEWWVVLEHRGSYIWDSYKLGVLLARYAIKLNSLDEFSVQSFKSSLFRNNFFGNYTFEKKNADDPSFIRSFNVKFVLRLTN
jgi:hypothetical protein